MPARAAPARRPRAPSGAAVSGVKLIVLFHGLTVKTGVSFARRTGRNRYCTTIRYGDPAGAPQQQNESRFPMNTTRSLRAVAAGIALAGTGAAGKAWSASANANANASANVNSKFSVSLDVATVSFGFVDPGTTTDMLAAHVITCRSNHGQPWFLKIRYLVAVSDATLGARSSGGLGINQTVFTGLSGSDQTTYSSEASEEKNLPNGTDIAIDYEMVADANSVPGLKSWTVVYTLTETL